MIKIGNLISQKNSSTRFFMVPQSITFKYEQTKGRLTDIYNFPSDIAITQKGLSEYLAANLDYIVIDLEPDIKNEIIKIRKDCSNCENNFYLEYDGHLNSYAQEFLYEKYFK